MIPGGGGGGGGESTRYRGSAVAAPMKGTGVRVWTTASSRKNTPTGGRSSAGSAPHKQHEQQRAGSRSRIVNGLVRSQHVQRRAGPAVQGPARCWQRPSSPSRVSLSVSQAQSMSGGCSVCVSRCKGATQTPLPPSCRAVHIHRQTPARGAGQSRIEGAATRPGATAGSQAARRACQLQPAALLGGRLGCCPPRPGGGWLHGGWRLGSRAAKGDGCLVGLSGWRKFACGWAGHACWQPAQQPAPPPAQRSAHRLVRGLATLGVTVTASASAFLLVRGVFCAQGEGDREAVGGRHGEEEVQR
jgi:hypothetical protein